MSYAALVGPGLSFAGVDQGIDFTGPGDVYAPFGAVVTRVQPSGSGWPGQGAVLNLLLLEGPAKGHYLYYAEDLQPAAGLRQGSRVPAGAVIGHATGSGQAPGIEIGWAQPSGVPLAPRPAPRPANQYTPQGDAFNKFVQALSAGKTPRVEIGHSGLFQPPGGGVYVPGKGADVGQAATHIPGVAQVLSISDFLGRLTDPSYILRGLQIAAGAAMAATGAVLLARQVALAADLPDPAQLAAGATGGRAAAALE